MMRAGRTHEKTILVTGGTGYIGSHVCVALQNAGYAPVIVDNLCNSYASVVQDIEKISGRKIPFFQADVCDPAALAPVFESHPFFAVIHLAGLKSVGESIEKPVEYYRNNLDGLITLLECMARYKVKRLIYSSSATVYGDAQPPVTEETRTGSGITPYGWTKYMGEQIIRDYARSDASFSGVLLRYFNPVGAHESGLIGESPKGLATNLMPIVQEAAFGGAEVRVFGNDYDTPDGTCIRDYIHVMDLSEGHVSAIEYAAAHPGVEAINLGTGRGCSVLELIETYERANGVVVPNRIAQRRQGDAAVSYASPAKAKALLGWEAKRDMADMCRSAFLFRKNENEKGGFCAAGGKKG